MEIYDIVMLVVLLGAMLFGAVKGFAWQLASIASILVSYLVAYKYRVPFSQSIQADPPWNQFLAMLILYVGTSLVIWVAFRMISGTIDRCKLREFDRQVGAVFGLAKGALYCTLITLFAVTLMGKRTGESIFRSKSGHYIASVLDRSESVIPPEIHQVVQPYLERFDEEFNSSGDPQLLDRGEQLLDQQPWLTNGQPQIPVQGIVDQFQNGLPVDSNWGQSNWDQDLRRGTTQPPLSLPRQTWTPQRAQQDPGGGFQR